MDEAFSVLANSSATDFVWGSVFPGFFVSSYCFRTDSINRENFNVHVLNLSRCPIPGTFPWYAGPPELGSSCSNTDALKVSLIILAAGRENFSVRGCAKGPTGEDFSSWRNRLYLLIWRIAKATRRPFPFIFVCLCKCICFPDLQNGLFICLYETCGVGSDLI